MNWRDYCRRICWTFFREPYLRWFIQRESADGAVLWGSERAELVRAIARYFPFDSLLEVGCGYGQNFDVLSRLFPKAQLTGIDIDSSRIKAAEDLFKNNSRIEFRHLAAVDLKQYSSGSFDVVITSAALLYIDAESIESVAREMFRIARHALILLEQHEPRPSYPEQHRGRFIAPQGTTPGYWLRDYESLFRELTPKAEITVTRIQNPRFTTEQWDKLGHVIEVHK